MRFIDWTVSQICAALKRLKRAHILVVGYGNLTVSGAKHFIETWTLAPAPLRDQLKEALTAAWKQVRTYPTAV